MSAADAFAVSCRYCHAPIDGPCINQVTKKPMHRFAAHLIRIKDAEESDPF